MNLYVPAMAAALLAATAVPSRAMVTIDLVDNGTNVVATASGTFDTTALIISTASGSASVWPGFVFGSSLNVGGSVISDPVSTQMNVFKGIAGPTSFGSGATRFFANQATGDRIGLIANSQLQLPLGYASGTSLSGTATWLNQSLTTLGLTAGTYTWTWGNGANADSLILNISAVPEPQSLALMLAGLAMGAVCLRRRQG